MIRALSTMRRGPRSAGASARRWAGRLIVVSAIFGAALPSAANRHEIPASSGMVIGFKGSDDNRYRIIRAGKPPKPAADVGILTEIHPGDRIEMEGPSTSLQIRLNDGEIIEKTENFSIAPLAPDEAPRRPDILGNAISRMSASLVSWFSLRPDLEPNDMYNHAQSQMHTRAREGGELDAPLLDSAATLKLLAGERPFLLEWDGGQPPFRLSILPIGAYHSIVPEWERVDAQQVGPATIDLAPGVYSIKVEDADGDEVAVALEAVDLSAMPVPPPGLRASAEAEQDLAGLAFLAWLTYQDRSWVLEGYRQARALAHRLPIADVLAERLADGRPMPVTGR